MPRDFRSGKAAN